MKNKVTILILLFLSYFKVFSQNTLDVYTINLSYKIFTDPTTGAFPTDLTGRVRNGMIENIKTSIMQMNQLAQRNNTNFLFKLYEDPILIGGPCAKQIVNKWFNKAISSDPIYKRAALEQDARSNATDFSWRDNCINIYLTGLGWGGECSFPSNNENVIAMAVDADVIPVIHFHEIGHYFELYHTHGNADCRDKTAAGDDGISDTYLDNSCWTEDEMSLRYFNKRYAELSDDEKNKIDKTWLNIMSYRPNETKNILTEEQIRKWNKYMIDFRRYAVQSNCKISSNVNRVSSSSAEITFDLVQAGGTKPNYRVQYGGAQIGTTNNKFIFGIPKPNCKRKRVVVGHGLDCMDVSGKPCYGYRYSCPERTARFEVEYLPGFFCSIAVQIPAISDDVEEVSKK